MSTDASVCTWGPLACGTWGEWVAGIGTVLAVFAAITIAVWEAVRQRKRERKREADEEAGQARAIHVWMTREEAGVDEDGQPRMEVVLHYYNSSPKPVFDLTVDLEEERALAATFGLGASQAPKWPVVPLAAACLPSREAASHRPGMFGFWTILFWTFRDAEGRRWTATGETLKRR